MIINRHINNIILKDVMPCSLRMCICVEYLNFTSKKDISFYRQCFRTKIKEKGIYDDNQMVIRNWMNNYKKTF